MRSCADVILTATPSFFLLTSSFLKRGFLIGKFNSLGQRLIDKL